MSSETPSEPRSAPPLELPRTWPMVAGGALLVLVAVLIGRYTELGPRLALDINGTRIQGTAERTDEGAYVLRYTHPSGAIHRKRYTGPLGAQASDEPMFSLVLVYRPEDPMEFQPVGISYIPGTIAGALFLTGFTMVLRARQTVHRRIRARRL